VVRWAAEATRGGEGGKNCRSGKDGVDTLRTSVRAIMSRGEKQAGHALLCTSLLLRVG